MGYKGRPGRRADNLTAICEPTVYKIWESRYLTSLWASTACYKDNFTFILHVFYLKMKTHKTIVFSVVLHECKT
jgi:hypothetical protein